MTDRKLFGTNNLIKDFTERLTKVANIDDGWSTEYVDSETGQRWLKYVVDDRNLVENLMLISPKPTTDELIDIAFTSSHIDEVAAAATRLAVEEQIEKKEYRLNLIDRLNQIDISKLDEFGKERFKTIIQASQLTDRVNKRDILNKDVSQVLTDATFFATTADKAQRLLNML